MKRLERLKYEHAAMDALMTRLSKFGAGDTEPDWHYQDALRNAFKGQPFKNLTAREWEIFYEQKGAGTAARLMNAQTRKVVNVILKGRISEMAELRMWAINNLRRVDLT